MDTGVDVFVQSNSTLVSSGQKLQVTDCVASPNEIVDLSSPSGAPIWPLIEAGCALDETILILPRGPLDQVRFLFESFRFQGEISGAQVTHSSFDSSLNPLRSTCNAATKCAKPTNVPLLSIAQVARERESGEQLLPRDSTSHQHQVFNLFGPFR